MHPEIAFEVAGISIRIASYSLFAILGAAAGATIAMVMLGRAGLKIARSFPLLVFMAVFFLAGARIWNYLVLHDAYSANFKIWTFKFAGFSVYGGILGALGSLLVFARLYRKNVFILLDAFVIPSAIAFALARTGCYLNGCCSGKITHSILGVHFPEKGVLSSILGNSIPLIGSINLPVYPTQIFEMVLALLGLIPVIWLYSSGRFPPGTSFLSYFIWACIMRWVVLYFRELPYPSVVINVVYPLTYALMAAAAGVILFFLSRNHNVKGNNDTKGFF